MNDACACETDDCSTAERYLAQALAQPGGDGWAAGELTSTERQVARLVADGLRSREIGARLYMAIATVEVHLTRVDRKLGVRPPAELARLVAEDVATVEPLTAGGEGSDGGRSIVT